MRNERFSSRQWRGASFYISPLDCFSRPATLQALYCTAGISQELRPRVPAYRQVATKLKLQHPHCVIHLAVVTVLHQVHTQPTTMISCRSDIHDQPALRRKRGTAQGWHVQHMIIMTTTDHGTGHQGFHPDRQLQSVYPPYTSDSQRSDRWFLRYRCDGWIWQNALATSRQTGQRRSRAPWGAGNCDGKV